MNWSAWCRHAGASVVGLHAHTGSGVFSVDNWQSVGETLTGLTQALHRTCTRSISVAGSACRSALASRASCCRSSAPRWPHSRPRIPTHVWIEPGRYLVAEAGVLLAQVTQLKGKGEVQYVGVATGMNSLIRPALYGAHHEILNLTRLDDLATEVVNVVGPICESGDQLGLDRLLPPTQEGDVLLIATAGAYGRAMSSTYNLREPAQEFVI